MKGVKKAHLKWAFYLDQLLANTERTKNFAE